MFGEMLADIFPDRTVLGGAPFNVARHLKAFGHNPVLITRLGNDALRDRMLQVMSQNGMETIGIQTDNQYPTGQVQVRIEQGEPRFEIMPLQAYDFINPSVVRMTTLSVHPQLVYFGTLAQRSETSARALRTLLRASHGKRFLDINLRTPWYDDQTIQRSLLSTDILKINDHELDILAKMFKLPGTTSDELARDLIERYGITQVIVTCGSQGSWLLDRNGDKCVAEISTPLSSLVDTVGAGDGYASACILGTLHGWPMSVTTERANSFAAAICGIRGAVPDHPDFYTPFISAWKLS